MEESLERALSATETAAWFDVVVNKEGETNFSLQTLPPRALKNVDSGICGVYFTNQEVSSQMFEMRNYFFPPESPL